LLSLDGSKAYIDGYWLHSNIRLKPHHLPISGHICPIGRKPKAYPLVIKYNMAMENPPFIIE